MNKILENLHLSTSKHEEVPPKEPDEQDLKGLRERYEKAGQAQVFAFYDELDVAGKAALYDQLSSFDPEYVNEISHKALHPSQSLSDDAETILKPLPESATASILDSKPEDIASWYDAGLDLVAECKAAVVLMAGGQGTRLGSSAPKGCFDIGLPSKKSLFQIQAERIWKVQQLAEKKHGKANVVIPWYVMTSGPTRGPTEKFFQEHNYFGLQQDDVMIFEQGVLPCISNEGKILLETKSKVWRAYYNNGYNSVLLTFSCRWQSLQTGTEASTRHL